MANSATCRIDVDNDGESCISCQVRETHDRCAYGALPRAIGEAVMRTEIEGGWRRDFGAVETLVLAIAYIDADPNDATGSAWPNKELLADVIRAVKAWKEADEQEAPDGK